MTRKHKVGENISGKMETGMKGSGTAVLNKERELSTLRIQKTLIKESLIMEYLMDLVYIPMEMERCTRDTLIKGKSMERGMLKCQMDIVMLEILRMI